MVVDLKNKTSQEILSIFRALHVQDAEIFEAEILESDIEKFGYKALVDLAQLFFMKLLTPVQKDKDTTILRFYKLIKESSFHNTKQSSVEKYGVESEFFNIDKTSQFSFLYHYEQALNFVDIKKRKRVLNLGVNRGDEFKIIKDMLTPQEFEQMEFVGIDYCPSAIEYAKREFCYPNVEFVCHNIVSLNLLDLGRFDLIITIGTLQSSNLNFNTTLMSIFQNHLINNGTMILGFPNCRWTNGEMIYGAKAPNYAFSELGLMLGDISFCKKYLQQKKYRVVVCGKDYLFLSAKKIIAKN